MQGATRLGIIAGEGLYPALLAKQLRDKGDVFVVCVAIADRTSKEISDVVNVVEWIKLYELKKIIDILTKNKVYKVMLAGRLTREDFLLGADTLPEEIENILAASGDTKVNTILKKVEELLKNYSIEIIDPTPYISTYIPSRGILTNNKPDNAAQRDIQLGARLAKIIADMDVGQTVILKNSLVIAVEAMEGTDRAIRRAKDFGISGAVVVKMARSNQDMRFDVPVVGFDTIEAMKEIKASCLAVEADKTLILDKEALLREADASGICVVAI